MTTKPLKISKSWKQIMKSRILPKNERNTLRIVSWGCFVHFFGRIKDIIICFRDLLTFRRQGLRRLRLLFTYMLFSVLKWKKILEDSLDSIPSPSSSVKIQITGRKVGLRFKVKKLLGVVKTNSFVQILLTTHSLAKKIKCSGFLEGDGIKSKLPFKIFSTLHSYCNCVCYK